MENIKVSEMEPLNTPYDFHQQKSKLIRKKLREIRALYKKNFKKYKKHKRLSTIFKVVINVLNAVTVSSAVIAFSSIPIISIITIASSTLSTIISVINNTIDFQSKSQTYQTTYLNLKDLYDSNTSSMLSKHSNLDDILNDINNKLGIILDSANPVSISSTDETI